MTSGGKPNYTIRGHIIRFVGFHRNRWIGNQVRNNKNKEATKMESFKTIKKSYTYIHQNDQQKKKTGFDKGISFPSRLDD